MGEKFMVNHHVSPVNCHLGSIAKDIKKPILQDPERLLCFFVSKPCKNMLCLFRWCSALVNTMHPSVTCEADHGWPWVTMGDHGTIKWCPNDNFAVQLEPIDLPPSSTMTCSPGSTLCSTTCMCSHNHASHWRCRIVHESLQRMGGSLLKHFSSCQKVWDPKNQSFPII